jgi:hypothetical protein
VVSFDRTQRRRVRQRPAGAASGTVVSPEKRRGVIIGYCDGAVFFHAELRVGRAAMRDRERPSTTPL